MVRKIRNLLVNIIAVFITDSDKRRLFRNKYKIKSDYRRLKDHINILKNEINELRRFRQQNRSINKSNISSSSALYLSDAFELKIVGNTRILDELVFNAPVYLFDATVSNVTIDACSCIYSNSAIYSAKIGKYCTVGEHALIKSTYQDHSSLTTSDMINNALFIGKDGIKTSLKQKNQPTVTIEHDAKICSHCLIDAEEDITIGIGAVIMSGSVVHDNIEPYAIIQGTAGNQIGKRFSDKVIDQLLSSKWWEYDWAAIMSSKDLAEKFNFTEVNKFLEVFRDFDKNLLPKIDDRFKHVTVSGREIKVDDLVLRQ